MLPEAIEVLVVDDGSTDATVDDRRGSAGGVRSWSGRDDPAPAPRRPRRQGRGGPGRDARRDRGPDRLRRCRHGDAARPAAVARRGAGRPRRRARLADPARRLGHARDASPATGGCWARPSTLLASIWVVGPVQDTQCGFKGFTRAAAHDLFARQQITSIVFDVELIYLARRRGYRIAIVPIRWYDRRGSRMRARPGAGAARRLGPVPDPAHPSRAAGGARHPGRDGPAGARPASAGRRCRSSPCLVFARWSSARSVVAAGDTLGFDFLAYHQAAVRLLNGQPLYDMSFADDRRLRALLLPADVRAAHPAVRPARRRRRRSGPGPRSSIGRSSSGSRSCR